MLFSAPVKLAGMCSRIAKENKKCKGCGKKHANPYVDCKVGVLYQIPLKCGKVYIGQTGRCINDRMREQELSVKNKTGDHLPTHCQACTSGECVPLLKEVKVLCRCSNTRAREILEAYHVRKKGVGCVSDTSVFLHKQELVYLDACL